MYVMVRWEELSEYLTKPINFISKVIWEWMSDLLFFIYLEIIKIKYALMNFLIIILRGVIRVIIYLAIIYFLLSIFGIDYSNSQIIIELLSKILKYFNDNAGAIQAIATIVLVIITARYAGITHRMLKLENKRYYIERERHFDERNEIQKKEAEERDKEYKSNIGIRKRRL